MNRIGWQHVILILGALVIVGALAWKGVDTTVIIGLVITLLGGLTYSQVSQVKDQSNGQMSKLMELIGEQSRTLSRTHPADPPTPEPEGKTDVVQN